MKKDLSKECWKKTRRQRGEVVDRGLCFNSSVSLPFNWGEGKKRKTKEVWKVTMGGWWGKHDDKTKNEEEKERYSSSNLSQLPTAHTCREVRKLKPEGADLINSCIRAINIKIEGRRPVLGTLGLIPGVKGPLSISSSGDKGKYQ